MTKKEYIKKEQSTLFQTKSQSQKTSTTRPSLPRKTKDKAIDKIKEAPTYSTSRPRKYFNLPEYQIEFNEDDKRLQQILQNEYSTQEVYYLPPRYTGTSKTYERQITEIIIPHNMSACLKKSKIKLQITNEPGKGRGLKALTDIPANTVLGGYWGAIRSNGEWNVIVHGGQDNYSQSGDVWLYEDITVDIKCGEPIYRALATDGVPKDVDEKYPVLIGSRCCYVTYINHDGENPNCEIVSADIGPYIVNSEFYELITSKYIEVQTKETPIKEGEFLSLSYPDLFNVETIGFKSRSEQDAASVDYLATTMGGRCSVLPSVALTKKNLLAVSSKIEIGEYVVVQGKGGEPIITDQDQRDIANANAIINGFRIEPVSYIDSHLNNGLFTSKEIEVGGFIGYYWGFVRPESYYDSSSKPQKDAFQDPDRHTGENVLLLEDRIVAINDDAHRCEQLRLVMVGSKQCYSTYINQYEETTEELTAIQSLKKVNKNSSIINAELDGPEPTFTSTDGLSNPFNFKSYKVIATRKIEPGEQIIMHYGFKSDSPESQHQRERDKIKVMLDLSIAPKLPPIKSLPPPKRSKVGESLLKEFQQIQKNVQSQVSNLFHLRYNHHDIEPHLYQAITIPIYHNNENGLVLELVHPQFQFHFFQDKYLAIYFKFNEHAETHLCSIYRYERDYKTKAALIHDYVELLINVDSKQIDAAVTSLRSKVFLNVSHISLKKKFIINQATCRHAFDVNPCASFPYPSDMLDLYEEGKLRLDHGSDQSLMLICLIKRMYGIESYPMILSSLVYALPLIFTCSDDDTLQKYIDEFSETVLLKDSVVIGSIKKMIISFKYYYAAISDTSSVWGRYRILTGERWIVDTILDDYQALVQERYGAKSTFVLNHLSGMLKIQEGTLNDTAIQKIVDLTITSLDKRKQHVPMILCPYTNDSHFILYVMLYQDPNIYSIDSMNSKLTMGKNGLKILEAIHQRWNQAKTKTQFKQIEFAVQKDTVNCGVYVALLERFLMENHVVAASELESVVQKLKKTLRYANMRSIRHQMLRELQSGNTETFAIPSL
jgi:hypothetical protein